MKSTNTTNSVWTEAEDNIIKRYAFRPVSDIVEILEDNGYKRSCKDIYSRRNKVVLPHILESDKKNGLPFSSPWSEIDYYNDEVQDQIINDIRPALNALDSLLEICDILKEYKFI